MYEIDKKQFGSFLAEQRKKKGMTQKELAAKLLISDKAVSKWECGNSMPDISLLMPLADILGVTVTELLEGREIEQTAAMDTQRVEELMKKTLTLSDRSMVRPKNRLRNGLIIGGCAAVAALEIAFLYVTGFKIADISDLLVMEILGSLFGIYFWLFIREKLPAYFDENKISCYSDGKFRINMAGIRFNNNNWPYIVRTGRIWTAVTTVCMPVLYYGICLMLPQIKTGTAIHMIVLVLYLGSLFIPMYIVSVKYE